MGATELQNQILDMQEKLIGLQAEFSELSTESQAAISEVLEGVEGNEINPNADEFLILYTGAGEEAILAAKGALESVNGFLQRFFAKLG